MKTYRTRLWGAVAGVAVATLAFAGCAGGEAEPAGTGGGDSGGDIRIGDITAVTGQFGAFGEALQNGVDLAVEELNADGGIAGRNLVVESADDGGDKAEAIAQFRRFASDESVLAIVGPNLSSNALATTPLANDAGVPMIVSGALAPWSVPFGEWVFRVPPVSTDSIKLTMEQVDESFDFQEVAIVSASDVEQSTAAAEEFRGNAEDLGYDIVEDVQFRSSDSDYSAMLTSIANSGAEAVFVSAVAVNAGPMVAQAADLGLDVQWIGDGGLLNPQFLELGGAAADGTITATTYFPGATGEKQTAFTEAYREKYDSDPSQNSAFGYDAVMMLAAAIEDIEGEVTRESLREALSAISFDGVTGTFSFPDGSGDSIRESQTLVQVQDGQFVEFTG